MKSPLRLFHLSLGLLVLALAALPMTSVSAQGKRVKKSGSVSPGLQGRKLFVNNCAACHGSSGQGGEGPNLHGLALSNAKIASTISGGIKGEMPAFGSKLRSGEIKALIAYIRTLKK